MNILSPTVLQALERIGHLPLFYPSSGCDLLAPIKTFAPYIKEFWFVDKDYFKDGQPEPEKVRYVLGDDTGYELLHVDCSRLANIEVSEWKEDANYQACPPVVCTEIYRHLDSGNTITVHRHRRTGPSALRTEVKQLGIFYYRGDSDDGGGSRTEWLTICKWPGAKEQKKIVAKDALIFEVLDKLVDGGLLVTDGSMCKDEPHPYWELQRFHMNQEVCANAVHQAQPFTDPTGRTFRCIDYAGERDKGPTLIWQVSRPQGENING